MTHIVFVILIMTIFGSFGALNLKLAANKQQKLLNNNLYIGVFFYVFSIVLNIYLLKFLEYSVVLPVSSLTYIWTLILASKVLNEKITINKIIGIALISVGITAIFVF